MVCINVGRLLAKSIKGIKEESSSSNKWTKRLNHDHLHPTVNFLGDSVDHKIHRSRKHQNRIQERKSHLLHACCCISYPTNGGKAPKHKAIQWPRYKYSSLSLYIVVCAFTSFQNYSMLSI